MERRMGRRMMRVLQGALVVAAICAGSLAARAAEAVRYELRFERPNTHLMDVTVHAGDLKGPAVEFAMPDWAPGSYYIENYAANVQRFRATDGGGKELAWRKTDSQTWRVELAGAKEATIEYQVFGDTLQNNLAQYNDKHVFIGGPSVWMYLAGGKERPVELSISVPFGWRVATGMEHTSASTFRAADYNWFADAPLEISDFVEKTFDVRGTTYHVIVHDVMGKKDFAKFAADVQKMVETTVPMWSTVAGNGEQAAPFKEYYFLFHIWPNTGGGLEHLNSTQINFRNDWDATGKVNYHQGNTTEYQLKLFVTSHEFFHAWNVKRLRPRPLGPFDYSQMVHTPSLWISEGLTSYYGSLDLARAGLITPQEYLDDIAGLLTAFDAEPGRKERSIEDTSWDTWFPRAVRQENNLQNTNYSYYDGGQIMGHILDFAIRQATHNQKSLDDWMRLLYSRYALPKPGFEPEDAIRAANEVAGTDVSELFKRYISGKEPIPYEKYFAYAAITVEKKIDTEKAWIGVSTGKGDDGRATVQNVVPGSPAEASGIDRGDSILAVDDRTVDFDAWGKMGEDRKPGETLKITVVRLGQLKEISLTLGTNPNPKYTLKLMENATDEQKAIFNSWMGIAPAAK